MYPTLNLFGHSVALYDPLNAIAYVAALIVLICRLKTYRTFSTFPAAAEKALLKKPISFAWRLFCGFEALVIFALTAAVTAALNNPLSQLFLGDNSANYFPYMFFVPVLLFVFGVLLRVSPLKLEDYFAPLGLVILIIVKLACYFQGCCNGVELSGPGPFPAFCYNQNQAQYQVPVQLIEMACAVVMLIVLILVGRRKNRKTGLLYPLFMLMYCGSRFISEFWRGDYPAVWGRLTGYHIQCIIGFVLGAVYLVAVLIWGERITAFFETRNKAWLDGKLGALKTKKRKKNKGKNIVHAKKRRKK